MQGCACYDFTVSGHGVWPKPGSEGNCFRSSHRNAVISRDEFEEMVMNIGAIQERR
jgi:hypothetical protein